MASLTTILDMVKVMSFAVQEGKMAVHCHAGLGRTGLQHEQSGIAQICICTLEIYQFFNLYFASFRCVVGLLFGLYNSYER